MREKAFNAHCDRLVAETRAECVQTFAAADRARAEELAKVPDYWSHL